MNNKLHNMRFARVMVGLLIPLFFVDGGWSADPERETVQSKAEKLQFFENTIRPLFTDKCVDCHSGDDFAESSLAFVSRESLITGADFGPAIIPGRAADSTLIKAVKWTHKELRMPPDRDDRLSAGEVAALIRWINEGAVWPKSSDSTKNGTSRANETIQGRKIETDHWAFQKRVVVEPPEVKNKRWMKNPIDRFIEAMRQEQNLQAVDAADRSTLIRRLTFDLIGLPPTPDEVQEFVNDNRSDDEALGLLVDRLLASRHYGERWGRHWMDVARYADTQGDVGDYPIPDAWRYRNWIINAFNKDLPFNEFLRAQIAGDIIAEQKLENGLIDENEARDLVIATGYIALSQRYGNSKDEHLHLAYENTIDTLGRGVLGLTLRCSRCHDHPFDPVLQTDYYGLYGILESTDMPWMGMSIEKSPTGLVPSLPDKTLQKQAKAYWNKIARYEYQINNHFRPWLKSTLREFKSIHDQWKKSELPDRETLAMRREELLSRFDGKFRELMLHGLNWLRKEKSKLARKPPFEMVFAVSEGQPHDSAIQRRGEPKRKGPIVARRFLQVIDGPAAPEIDHGSGRLELANWLVEPDHPLVPRVIVNRIWQRHFGRGLVVTSDNFGVQGKTPSHPHLLDWLSQQFIDDGWSLKQLHRRIVMSQTYRLSSNSTPREGDPENIYLTRYTRRRLEGEAIRDAMLAVNGRLNRTQAQGHPLPRWDTQRYGLNGPFHAEYETDRRSVYLLTQRLFNHSFLGLFDPPDRNMATAVRSSADVPGQSLFLMNSPFIRKQAEAFAKRLLKERSNDQDRIIRAFQLAYGRVPDPQERDRLAAYIDEYQQAAQTDDTTEAGDRRLWASIARTLITSNEFFFID